MTLEELIEALEIRDQDKVVKHGFSEGMSWRGAYSEAAFTPAEEVTFGDMLRHARELLGSAQEGYKGGVYEMHPYVDVHIAHYGECGEPINSMNFRYWDEC